MDCAVKNRNLEMKINKEREKCSLFFIYYWFFLEGAGNNKVMSKNIQVIDEEEKDGKC